MDKQIQLRQSVHTDKLIKPASGLGVLLITLLAYIGTIAGTIILAANGIAGWWVIAFYIFTGVYCSLIGPIIFSGLKVLNPNEALVLTLFGKYYGTIASDGFFFVNPFCSAINPLAKNSVEIMMAANQARAAGASAEQNSSVSIGKKISLKAMTLNNDKQKVNDQSGNPIEIGVIVIWKIVDSAKAVLDVDNYVTYVSTQCDSAIRNVARQYPYDISTDGDEKSLRGSSQEIADVLREELQKRAEIAGVEILEARISHLAYAQEIAAVMLQRQQADAIIAARQKIVEGAVGMVEMALTKLSENGIVELDDERKAQMVSNLLVVLCGNKDAQPIVNSGSIY